MILNNIKAVIFDMDGLLIDSEPYWKIAEKEVFGKLGLTLTDDLLRQVMGFRLNEVVLHWYNFQPWQNPNFKQTEIDILTTVKELIFKHAKPMPGVFEVLTYFKEQNIPMAVASSSAMELINVVINKLQIGDYFSKLYSAEFEDFGKPHPGIFISTANFLQVEPTQCLVFEDSVNGVIAAKAARMQCIAIPEIERLNDPKFSIADNTFKSLNHFLSDCC